MRTDITRTALAPVQLNLVVEHFAESWMPGCWPPQIREGWYWWYEAIGPGGAEFVGQTHGPFTTKDEATKVGLADYKSNE